VNFKSKSQKLVCMYHYDVTENNNGNKSFLKGKFKEKLVKFNAEKCC